MKQQRRQTKNKQLILQQFEQHHLLSAADLSEKLSTVDPSIIYRNLQRFTEDGVLQEVPVDGVVLYELAATAHEHLVCDDCHRVQAIELDVLQLQKILGDAVTINPGTTVMHGRCAQCM